MATIPWPVFARCETSGIDNALMVRIYVDTNAFIAAFEHSDEVTDRLISLFFRPPLGRQPLLVTSALSTSELLVKPMEFGKNALVAFYKQLTLGSHFLDVVPISRDILVGAAEIRAAAKAIKLPDAIHIATAVHAECTHFLTNDLDIRDSFTFRPIRLIGAELDSILAELDDGH